ncbi:MAG: hypothetical protein ACTSRU_14325, partial [Candidatus Hodarchaeales archaeon]
MYNLYPEGGGEFVGRKKTDKSFTVIGRGGCEIGEILESNQLPGEFRVITFTRNPPPPENIDEMSERHNREVKELQEERERLFKEYQENDKLKKYYNDAPAQKVFFLYNDCKTVDDMKKILERKNPGFDEEDSPNPEDDEPKRYDEAVEKFVKSSPLLPVAYHIFDNDPEEFDELTEEYGYDPDHLRDAIREWALEFINVSEGEPPSPEFQRRFYEQRTNPLSDIEQKKLAKVLWYTWSVANDDDPSDWNEDALYELFGSTDLTQIYDECVDILVEMNEGKMRSNPFDVILGTAIGSTLGAFVGAFIGAKELGKKWRKESRRKELRKKNPPPRLKDLSRGPFYHGTGRAGLKIINDGYIKPGMTPSPFSTGAPPQTGKVYATSSIMKAAGAADAHDDEYVWILEIDDISLEDIYPDEDFIASLFSHESCPKWLLNKSNDTLKEIGKDYDSTDIISLIKDFGGRNNFINFHLIDRMSEKEMYSIIDLAFESDFEGNWSLAHKGKLKVKRGWKIPHSSIDWISDRKELESVGKRVEVKRKNPLALKRHKNRMYYHGTNKDNAIKILREGVIKHGIKTREHGEAMKPRPCKTYISKKLEYSLVYALGFGVYSPGDELKFRPDDRYVYIFEIDGKQLGNIEPDEDDVGKMIHEKR